MQAWWESLTQVLRILYCIAVPSSLILILQLLFSTIGGANDGGTNFSDTSGIDGLDINGNGIPDIDEIDFSNMSDGGPVSDFGSLRMFTVQTVITFLAVFGWVSIVCISSGMSNMISLLIGAACGLCMMFIVAKLVQTMTRMAENGILDLKNAIGENATVYLTIPPKSQGTGKVTIYVQGRFCELDAVNAGEEVLQTGSQVLVSDVVGDTLVVEQC